MEIVKRGNLVLGGEDPRQWRLVAWLNLPLIPFSLLLSGSRLFGIFTTLVPFFMVPVSQHTDLDFGILYPGHTITDVFMYPPTPPLILASLPIMRHFYRQGMSLAF